MAVAPQISSSPDAERRHGDAAAVALALGRHDGAGRHQIVHRHFENPRHLAVRGHQRRAASACAHDRVQAKAADRNIDRRQRPDDANIGAGQRDFFVRLAQGRLFERFAGLDDAARQRHLSTVSPQRLGAHGQHDVSTPGARKEEQQASRIANPG